MDAILTDSALAKLMASFLPSNSLAACAGVNKRWNAHWTPYLYRHITFNNTRQVLCFHGYNNILAPTPVDIVPTGPEFHAWIKHATPTGLLKHGHHIRSISTYKLSVLDPLVHTGTCINLSSLRLLLPNTSMATWSQTALKALSSFDLKSQLGDLNNLAVDPIDPDATYMPSVFYHDGPRNTQPVRKTLTPNRTTLNQMQSRRWGTPNYQLHGQDVTPYMTNVSMYNSSQVALPAEGPNLKNLLITFLGQNPGLKELTVTDSFPFHHSQVLRAIGELPKLKELYLFSTISTKVDDSAVRHLLRKCKPHVEKMVFSLSYGGPLEPEFEEEDKNEESDTEDEEQEDNNWDVISRTSDTMDIDHDDSSHKSKKGAALRELLLEGDMHGREGPIWTPLLSECSRLQKLRVGLFSESFFGPLVRSLLQAQSFHLCDLQLGYVHTPSFLLDSDLAKLLSLASRPGWRRIRLTHFSGFGQRSMSELMKHTSTLEHLTIQFCGSVLIGPMVTALMTKCHKLKHLQIEFDACTQDSECDAGISARAIADGEQWVCDKLEYLMVQIKGVPRPDLLEEANPVNSGFATARPSVLEQPSTTTTSTAAAAVICPSMVELEAESQNLQQCVYEQLGYLTELRELHLTSTMNQVDHASYSMQPSTYTAPKRLLVNNNGKIMDMVKRARRNQREQNDSLAFTIDSGLDLLMRLDKLRVVNVSGMRHQIGVPELEWMSEHWTALKEIKGLFWDNDKQDYLRYKHPEMLQFLKKKREWSCAAYYNALTTLVQDLTVGPKRLSQIKEHFVGEMEKGLAKDGETLAMVPTYVTGRLDGSETRSYLTLDVGGTFLRVAFVELLGQGKFNARHKKYRIDEGLKVGEATLLFVDENGIKVSQGSELELGFTFSGLGTGSNGAYLEQIDRIAKWRGDRQGRTEMVINMEFGAFDNERTILPFTKYDKILDQASLNPGEQLFEKMIAGMYLGEIARNILLDLKEMQHLFQHDSSWALDTMWSFDTAYMSAIEADATLELENTGRVLETIAQVSGSTLVDRQIVKTVVQLVGQRAARLSSMALAGILCHLGLSSTGPIKHVAIGVDGSLYQFYPGFEKDIMDGLSDILGSQVRSQVNMGPSLDGSSVGAALAAVLAGSK
ncbi:glucokinase [Podila minutissima]|nr:glucokinase [Podila minutissima]